MTKNIYVGSVEGTSFAVVHSLYPQELDEAQGAFDAFLGLDRAQRTKCCTIAKLGDDTANDLRPFLGAEAQQVGNVSREAIAEYVGDTATKALFASSTQAVAQEVQ
jgi:hypothetical protein